ncbi:hypothetical protein [Actinomadura gamaensis]|uniref:Streptogrisin C n=1 Tax=Actinomadura gamaensis TaxID=1763541 RepID=A0ABV9U3S9_9ACTN
MMIRRWTVMVAAVAAALAVAGLPVGRATAGPSAVAVPADVRESVAYLTRTYHVPAAEALRRLDLQRTSADLAPALARRDPAYAGMWLDQDHGGVLVVGSVDPERTARALAGTADRGHIRIARVAHSRAELVRAADAVAATMPADPQAVTIDDVHDQVSVSPAETAPLTAQTNTAIGRFPGLVQVHRAPRGTPGSCSMSACPPPLRGGLKLDLYNNANQGVGNCTLGFNVRGSNGWLYTITAGHCLSQNGAHMTAHNYSWVGYDTGSTFVLATAYGNDFTLMPFAVLGGTNYAAYWNPAPWVFSGCFHSPQPCTDNTAFPITYGSNGGIRTYGEIQVGWVACAGGWTDDTQCGHVTGKSNGIIMDICRYHGDSGGPLYSQVDHSGYGIFDNFFQPDGSPCPYAGASSEYTALSSAFTWANHFTGLTYAVKF